VLVSCSAANEKAVVKRHRKLKVEGVNVRGRAEERQKEKGYMGI
jgi:hypothetical protein